MIKSGTCRLCGEQRFVLAADDASSERLDSIATLDCDCRLIRFKKGKRRSPEDMAVQRWI